ncbi:MAG TPA: hypothetical protein PKI93_08015 [Alphaproteobacteria bacterium]|nr:hypothetical protein [Alphaproteobacteria bacterium]HNS43591.1 hypothetical protein [Alphaproteobacteria bacterium]
MRFVLSFLAVMALISSSAVAAENSSKPVLVKGTKSYQSRAVNTEQDPSVEMIEPAAGEDNAPMENTDPSVKTEEPVKAPALEQKLHLPRKN